MADRLADLIQASEANQKASGGGAPKREKMRPIFYNPAYTHGNKISWIVGTFGKRLITKVLVNFIVTTRTSHLVFKQV